MIAVRIDSLNFRYENEKPIIVNAYYNFASNSIYSISAPNGAGKTTLLRLVCKLLKPDFGAITIDPALTIGYLPDRNGLYEELTIKENIKFRLALYKLSYQKQKAKIEPLLEKFSLTEHQNCQVKQLSLGMKKKTALIATFAAEPKLIVLDEPTSGIDNSSKKGLIEFLINTSKNTTIICTSHDKEITGNNSFRQLILSQGKIIG